MQCKGRHFLLVGADELDRSGFIFSQSSFGFRNVFVVSIGQGDPIQVVSAILVRKGDGSIARFSVKISDGNDSLVKAMSQRQRRSVVCGKDPRGDHAQHHEAGQEKCGGLFENVLHKKPPFPLCTLYINRDLP